jgi:hypothetical protein
VATIQKYNNSHLILGQEVKRMVHCHTAKLEPNQRVTIKPGPLISVKKQQHYSFNASGAVLKRYARNSFRPSNEVAVLTG